MLDTLAVIPVVPVGDVESTLSGWGYRTAECGWKTELGLTDSDKQQLLAHMPAAESASLVEEARLSGLVML